MEACPILKYLTVEFFVMQFAGSGMNCRRIRPFMVFPEFSEPILPVVTTEDRVRLGKVKN